MYPFFSLMHVTETNSIILKYPQHGDREDQIDDYLRGLEMYFPSPQCHCRRRKLPRLAQCLIVLQSLLPPRLLPSAPGSSPHVTLSSRRSGHSLTNLAFTVYIIHVLYPRTIRMIRAQPSSHPHTHPRLSRPLSKTIHITRIQTEAHYNLGSGIGIKAPKSRRQASRNFCTSLEMNPFSQKM